MERKILIGKKVLIVDDCSPLNEVISKFCTMWGAHPLLAINADEMMEIWKEENPDLILLHLHTAGMENFDKCRAIKSLHDTNVSILLTSSDHFELKNAVFKEPELFDDYLPKPYHINQFYEKAVRLIQKGKRVS
ncbi:MAG: response regulator [Deltaproteobacteria bacterium]|nr:response regulator [Deltaproteobacteria bacterium]